MIIKVSVIIPVYNTEEFLERCITSILSQTLNEIEIIIINDGSIDNSQKVIDSFVDDRIIKLNQKNKGASSARNLGLKIARGKYISYIDSDDYIHPEMLEKMYSEAIASELDIVIGNGIEVSENLKKEFYNSPKVVGKILKGSEYFVLANEEKSYRIGPCYNLYLNNFLKENKFYFLEEVKIEDEYYTPQVLLSAKRVMNIGKAYYFYRKRNGSLTMSSVVTDKDIVSYMIIIDKITDLMVGLEEKTKKILKMKRNYLIYHLLIKKNKINKSVFGNKKYIYILLKNIYTFKDIVKIFIVLNLGVKGWTNLWKKN